MDIFRPGEFARRIGRTVSTLQKWDRSGRLKARRSVTNRRFYTDEDLRFVLRLKGGRTERRSYTYCRVSSAGQKRDLLSQKSAVQEFCQASGIPISEHLWDVGSGLNYKRKSFIRLMDLVENGEVATIIVAHKDRLVRFGFEWFEEYCKKHGTQIVIMNNESLSPEEEMTWDLLAIVHCFSSRLYGLRKYGRELKKMIKDSSSSDDKLRSSGEVSLGES